MFSFGQTGARRVRAISGVVASVAMIAAFTFSASAASADATGGPTNTVAPSYTGALKSGGTIVATPGTWTDTEALTYTYLWQDSQDTGDGDYLSDTADYTIDSSEIDHELLLTVTATDTDGDSDTATFQTTAVPEVDFTNLTAPTLTGGNVVGDTLTGSNGTWSRGGLTFTYSWGIGYGQSGDSRPEITNTYTQSNDDLNGTIAFLVTASDASGSVAVSTFASAVTIPAPPVSGDADLTAANEGGVTGTQTKTVATVTIPSFTPTSVRTGTRSVEIGSDVFVYGYSAPTPLGFFTVSAAGTISVPLGALSKGLHKLAIVDQNGALVGWVSVTAGGGLASTGVPVNAPLELGAAGLLLLLGVLAVVFVTRQRRKSESL